MKGGLLRSKKQYHDRQRFLLKRLWNYVKPRMWASENKVQHKMC